MKDSVNSEAVVLTLRKRLGSVRKATRTNPSRQIITEDAGLGGFLNGENPWTIDSLSQSGSEQSDQNRRKIKHRLSFDDASGVIVLPEDVQWLMDDMDSDSEEDYRGDTLSNGDLNHEDGALAGSSTGNVPSELTSTNTRQRHGTYFHNPERRRQTMPGAYP